MISANQKKFVKSLAQKKFRKQHNCFVVEGVKMVEELLNSDFEVKELFATKEWVSNNQAVRAIQISNKDLASISTLKTPNEVLAIVKIPIQNSEYSNKLIIALDYIQDPGNLGTIIRTADWFGISEIICSTDSVDVYNPKVIQASMGSIFRVDVKYIDLASLFKNNKEKKIYGAILDGQPLTSKTKLATENAILLLGNESKGVSEKLKPFVNHPIAIAKVGDAESLNVASAAAILCYHATQF